MSDVRGTVRRLAERMPAPVRAAMPPRLRRALGARLRGGPAPTPPAGDGPDLPRALAQRDRARARLREAHARAGILEAELHTVYARLAEVDADRLVARKTMEHYQQVAADFEARVASGRAALFDYPHLPRPREFSRPGKAFFHEQVSAGDRAYADLLGELAGHLAPMRAIPDDETEPHLPHWSNPWLPPLDGIAIYGLLAHHRPALYMEVGSGNSTKFARRAIADHGLDTQIVSIDPYPRAEVDDLCDEVIRTPYEEIDPAVLDRLTPGDMLFVDNSHRAFTNSDVTVFFTETLPYLRSGVVYGIHDTFIPHDYPAEWNDRFYAEQYLLMCYLAGGAAGDEVLLGTHHVATSPHLLEHLIPFLPPTTSALVGGGFWMTRR